MHAGEEGNRNREGKKSDERFVEVKIEGVGIRIFTYGLVFCDEPIMKPWKKVAHKSNRDKKSDQDGDETRGSAHLGSKRVVGSAQKGKGDKNLKVDELSHDSKNGADSNK